MPISRFALRTLMALPLILLACGDPAEEATAATGSTQAQTASTAPVNIDDLRPEERSELAKLYIAWAAPMVEGHTSWHDIAGIGAQNGVGFRNNDERSGESFLQFHSNLLRDFMALLRSQTPALFNALHGQIPVWDTMRPLPVEFQTSDITWTSIHWKIPSYATVSPDSASFTMKVLRSGKVSDLTVRSLNDCQTPDELGRLLGESGIHQIAHNRLFGVMNTPASVGHPAFLLWHGVIESIRTAWLTTASGQSWLQSHPSGWTDAQANPHKHASHTH